MQEILTQGEEYFPQIQENLMEPVSEKGAYYCAYPSFVDVYRAMCRGMERIGQNVMLMVCNLHHISPQHEKRNEQEVADWLKTAICISLRRGDMYTRYSRNRYLILLIGVTQPDCGIIMKRIKRKFEENRRTKNYYLEFDAVSATDDFFSSSQS